MLLQVCVISFAVKLCSSIGAHGGEEMECGKNVPFCGVLTLESGMGGGYYHHRHASVHGLWPETGQYGTSKCVPPADRSGPKKIYDCYARKHGEKEQIRWFEEHEWTKHGMCAGVKDVDDFFGQVCALSKEPVAALARAREEAGQDFDLMAQALRDDGYPVWKVDEEYDQVLLSACAGDDGRWVLSTIAEMPSKCPGTSPGPTPGPTPAEGSCKPGIRGPACESDDDCSGLSGCIRCAHSGHCTDEPLFKNTSSATVLV